MREEESYKKIVEMLSNGNFLQLNGKAINLTELNEYINAQQEEIERLHSIIKEVREYIDNDFNRFDCFGSMKVSMEMNYKREELLEILDKVGDNNVKD